jgi:hypothetical protein
MGRLGGSNGRAVRAVKRTDGWRNDSPGRTIPPPMNLLALLLAALGARGASSVKTAPSSRQRAKPRGNEMAIER